MCRRALHIKFAEHVEMDEVRGTLALARVACEALHGLDRVALEPAAEVDLTNRRVVLDPTTPCGRDLATLFFGLARREFGAVQLHFDAEGR